MAHKLKIEVEDIHQDPNYIRFIDWSEYDDRIEVTNKVCKVEIPGEENFKLVRVPTNGSIAYNSKSLKLSTDIQNLPDGLYVVTFSVCPNEKVYTVVYHFRTVALEARLMAYVGKALNDTITSEVNNILVDCLLKVKALKANCIDNYNVQKAYDLYCEITDSINSLCLK